MVTCPPFHSQRFFYGESATAQLTIGISDCLTGAAVRYDGASKNFAAIKAWPRAEIRLLPLCPEVGAGMSVPRPPVQLVATSGNRAPSAIGRDDAALDVTAQLESFAAIAAAKLMREAGLCGYIWKSRSPSCGLGSTPIHDASGTQIATGNGIQAAQVQTMMPWLVAVEETSLTSPTEIARFLLLCRLVFDARWAGEQASWNDASALVNWSQHYALVTALFTEVESAELAVLIAAGDWPQFLCAFLKGCRNIEAEQLLGLFV